MNIFRNWFNQKQKYQPTPATTSSALLPKPEVSDLLSKGLPEIEQELRRIFGNTLDFYLDHLSVGKQPGLIVYLESMVNPKLISQEVVNKLTQAGQNYELTSVDKLKQFRREQLGGLMAKVIMDESEMVRDLLLGYVLIIIANVEAALVIRATTEEGRSITEPSTQTTIRGPKEGFVESLDTNITLIRKILHNPQLRFERYIVGKDTQTALAVCFINGIADGQVVEEVRRRIKDIQVSGVFDSGNIEEFITDKTITPFPTVYNTERPDSVAANLVEGKIAIITDGTPFVLLVPVTLPDFFQTTEDYAQPFLMASFIRVIRYVAFLISLVLPSLYLAVITYHIELIPTALLVNLMAQREGVPMPAAVEVLAMELTFEILREAGIRMPRAVGQTISIVGALVIGQAAVEAGIVSNTMVIVVALTAISNFVSPVYSFSVSSRLLRFVLILFASFLGLYGVLLGLVTMVAHLASLRSFGVPYLSPVAPLSIGAQKDVFIRLPIFTLKTRSPFSKVKRLIKQRNSQSPSPPEGDDLLS
ncbi:spore germination protein [Brevibacillus fulvus]|uniref:Spore germination protein KA n=1 Tax=Brevibacillus fulvus TaxID=1125967 RepID=A0A938XWX9_9BACL|nr:spore germination protein [Brevibacillus fulvus]MBM7588494.1 spore germination protein KA [Brevibacillus fulvus]